MKKQPTFSLKDQLFNHKTVSQLAGWFSDNDNNFPTEQFCTDCISAFPQLELKQRITHITQTLHTYLPKDYPQAVQIILNALPPELDPTKTDNDFGEFIIAPLSEYISTYGCTQEHFEISRHALTEITKRHSVEFAVRAFINTFPQETYQKFHELAHSDNYHQRRLVSEGSRITLPWAVNICRTPEQVVPLLDHLYDDHTRYVTRSVANNLNGLSKVNPDLVFKTLARRIEEGKQDPKEFIWIQKHSLRTLLRQGDARALKLFGYHDPEHLSVQNCVWTKQITIGETFKISFDLIADDGPLGKCKVDYAIGYLKKNGKHSDKVYKVTEIDSQERSLSFSKSQTIKLMTTRALYPGTHMVKVMVNGRVMVEGEFELQQYLS